jgi:hypothetical protein
VVNDTRKAIHKCHIIIYCNVQCIDNVNDAINEQQMGQWKDKKRNGKGTFYYANGQKYTGDFVDDKRTGQAVMTWPSGERYE